MTLSSYWPLLGTALIILGLIVKFEVKVITTKEEEQSLEESETKQQ